MGVDIKCFFVNKIFVNKTKTIYWRPLTEPVKHLSWSFLQKKLMVNSQKQFLQKVLS